MSDGGYFPIGYFSTGYFPEGWYSEPLGGEAEAVVGVGAGVLSGLTADVEGTLEVYVLPSGGWSNCVVHRLPLPITGYAEATAPEAIAMARGAVGTRASVAASAFLPTLAVRAVQVVTGRVLEDIRLPAVISRGAVGLSGDASIVPHTFMSRARGSAGVSARDVSIALDAIVPRARGAVGLSGGVSVALDAVIPRAYGTAGLSGNTSISLDAIVPHACGSVGVSARGQGAVPSAIVGVVAEVGNTGHAAMTVSVSVGKAAMEHGVIGSMRGRSNEVRATSRGGHTKFSDEQIQEIIAALLMAA